MRAKRAVTVVSPTPTRSKWFKRPNSIDHSSATCCVDRPNSRLRDMRADHLRLPYNSLFHRAVPNRRDGCPLPYPPVFILSSHGLPNHPRIRGVSSFIAGPTVTCGALRTASTALNELACPSGLEEDKGQRSLSSRSKYDSIAAANGSHDDRYLHR